MKIDIAMALARKLSGTDSIISVLTGPVDRNSRNIETARRLMVAAVLVARKAANEVGTEMNTVLASSQAYPAGVRFCQAVAVKPPVSVPTNPATKSTSAKNQSA